MDVLKFSLLICVLLCFKGTILQAQTSMENVKEIWSRYAKVTSGLSTYYNDYPGGGACALDPVSPLNKQPDWMLVAAGKGDFQTSLGCGMCIEIKANGEQATAASGGPTPMKGTYKATIWDLCGGCKQAGFDFYRKGFGKYKTSFKAIECPTVPGKDGNIQLRFSGSDNWYIKLQARNSKVVTVGMEIEHNNKWVCMKRTADNFFTISGLGEIKFPKKFRITSISGEQLVATVSEVTDDVNIPTNIQYSGFNPDSNPESIKCYGQDGKSEQPIGPTNAPASGTAGGTKPTPAASTSPSGGQPLPTSKVPTSAGGSSAGGSSAPLTTAGGNNKPSPSPTSKPPGEPDEKFCNGKADGLYVDPNDFSNFYQCTNGITYWKHCPEGLLFNPDLNVCDWPTNVKYGAGGQKDVDERLHHGGSIIQILKKSEGLETSILSKQQ